MIETKKFNGIWRLRIRRFAIGVGPMVFGRAKWWELDNYAWFCWSEKLIQFRFLWFYAAWCRASEVT